MPGEFRVSGRSFACRSPNQDAWFARSGNGVALLGVCDGVGSSGAGREASTAACESLQGEFEWLREHFRTLVQQARGFGPALRQWWFGPDGSGGAAARLLRRLRARVLDVTEQAAAIGLPPPEPSAFQSTLTVVLAAEDRLGAVWVGDSRVYLFRDGRLRILTDDHVGHKNVGKWTWNPMAYFAIGSAPLARWLHPDAPMDWFDFVDEVPLESGDVFFACSDGFSELLYPHRWEQRMVDALLSESEPDPLLDLMTGGLPVGRADDTTVALATVGRARAFRGLARLVEGRHRILGLEPSPLLREYWRRLDPRLEGVAGYRARMDVMMSAMAEYERSVPVADVLARNGGGEPPRLTRKGELPLPSPGQSTGAAHGGLVPALETAEAGGSELLAFDSDARVLQCFAVPSSGVLALIGADGEGRVRIDVGRGSFSVRVGCGPAWQVWAAAAKEAPGSAGALPVRVLVGRTEVSADGEGVSIGGGIMPWPDDGVVRLSVPLDEFASDQHCMIARHGVEVLVRDLAADNGTWVLLGVAAPEHPLEQAADLLWRPVLLRRGEREIAIRLVNAPTGSSAGR